MVCWWDRIYLDTSRRLSSILGSIKTIVGHQCMYFRFITWWSTPTSYVFRSQFNQTFEEHYHNFVVQVACGRREIFSCRKYLWKKKFYWIYDCITIKEILEYCGSIHKLRHWSQERFGCEFTIIHRITSIMKDMDGLSRQILIY